MGGIAFVNLLIFGVVAFSLYQSFGEFEDRAEVMGQNLSLLLAQEIAGDIDKIDLTLLSSSDEIERQLAHGSIDANAINSFLERQQGRLPSVFSLRMSDANGIVRYGRGVNPAAHVNNSDREYFIRQRNNPKAGLVIGKPIITRIDGKWAIPISRAIHRPDGSFGGVVYINVAIEHLVEIFSAIDVGRRGSVSLRDADLRILARYPVPADAVKVIGEPLLVPELEKFIRAGNDAGTYVTDRTVDGVERRFAVHKLSGHPLYIVVGRSTEEYMAQWRDRAFKTTLLAALFCLTTLVSSWLIYRNWRRQSIATMKLVAEEEKFHTVADYTYDWEYWEGPEQEILFMSPSCERVTGYSQSEFQSDPELLHRIVHSDDRDLMAAHRSDAAHAEEAAIDFRIVRRDGAIRWIEHGCRAVFGQDGKFIGRRASNRDITERKRAEETAHRLNRELRAISKCNQTLIRAKDEQTLLDEICRVVCEEAGYRMVWVGYAEHDDARTIRPVAWAGAEDSFFAQTGLTWADNVRGRGPCGTAIRGGESVCIQDFAAVPEASPWRDNAVQRGYRSSTALPLKDEDGNAFGVFNIYSAEPNAFTADEMRLLDELAGDLAFGIMVLRACAERMRAEEALRVSEVFLQSIYEGADIPVGVLDVAEDGDLIVAGFNGAYERLHGMDRNVCVGMRVADFLALHGPDPGAIETTCRNYEHCLQSGNATEYEERVILRGRETWWLTRLTPVRDAVGRYSRLIATTLNITERKCAEEKTRRLNRELRAISNCNQILMRAKDEQTLLDEICHIVCEQAGYRMVWVGYAEYDDARTIRPVAWAGAETDFLAQTGLTWADNERGRGPCSTAIRDGEIVCIQDLAAVPEASPWRDNAVQRGYRSSTALPLKDEGGNAFGVLNIYSAEPNAFTADEIRILDELAGDLAFGIMVLRTRAERMRAEEALRVSEVFLQSIYEGADIPVWVLDVAENGDFIVAGFNGASERLHGIARNVGVGMRVADLLALLGPEPGAIVTTCRNYERCLLSGNATQYEERVVLQGRETWWLTHLTPVRDAAGRYSRLIVTTLNISERKRAEEEIQKLNRELEERVANRTAKLEAANKELEAFSYSVSHDLRAPLRAIEGFSHILQEDYAAKLDDEAKRLLGVVRDNTNRMSQLIDDILNFSRAGRVEITFSEIDMEKMAYDVVEELQPSIAGSKLQLDIEHIPPTRGDRAMMYQVFVNLLSNAIKFSRTKGTPKIQVGATIKGDETIYFVKDNGAGFNMQHADKLFSVFQRLHTISEFEGTGIGLAIIKRIITRHGGRVWAEGKVNEGATIYFALPTKGD